MDRKAFYDAVRPTLGALTQANVVGFELVLDEGQRRAARLHDLAYILATSWWESGRTMQPVREAFWLSETWRRKNLRYFPFYGRGLVQLTWEENYRKASELYGVDFVKHPDLVLEPRHSVNILFDGMKQGWFTGQALADHIDDFDDADDEQMREYKAARRVVNGTDRAVEIGKLAAVFETALKAASYGPLTIPAEPIIVPQPAPIGHNGGPPLDPGYPVPRPVLSPVEQSHKAVGAAKWVGVAGALFTALITADVLPDQFTSPEFVAAVTTLIGAVAGAVGAYRAPKNAEPN